MKNKGDKTMKKVLLTSAVALAAFGAVQAVSANDLSTSAGATNGGTVYGKVDPATGKILGNGYTENKLKSEHTGVVAPANQYKPAEPATNPYDVVTDKDGKVIKAVKFGNGSHVRFHVRDIKGNAVAGVKVDVMVYADADAFKKNSGLAQTVESNAAGDVELSVARGGIVTYRVAYVPKGYVVRQAKTDGQYTLTGYRGEHENLANGETHENAGTRAEGTYVISGSADLDKDTHADMFTNANVDLVLEKTDSYNVVKDQWVQEEAGWKYYASNKAVTGWKQVDGKWYFFNAEGVMQKWWVKDGNTWYYLNGSGAMETGWLQDGGKWYYLENSGAMKASQWFEVAGKWYYVDGSGALAVNTTVGGYTVNGNGEWVK